ncbi:nitrite reductase (NAD(P)H) [Pseudescherichia vulneris]|nr:nitrite reductase (NAD(P)H) [Pseudescherichia vulneris]
MGVEVKKISASILPIHGQELYHLVRVGNIRSFDELIDKHGHGYGCENLVNRW